MKKLIQFVSGIVAYGVVIVLFSGFGHTETHVPLNEHIVKTFLTKYSSTSFAESKFKYYEFNWNNTAAPELSGPAITQDYYLYYTSSDEVTKKYTPINWIKEGGWMEDEPWGPASLCHFYDPMAIDGGKKYLTDNSGLIESSPGLTQLKTWLTMDAKSWVMSSKNPYGWNKAKEYIIKALKDSLPSQKNQDMAMAYRCLGQSLHLLADMGCTPHVRNDSHPPRFPAEVFSVIGDPDPFENICKSLNVATYGYANAPNSYLSGKFTAAETYTSLFEELASFTNLNFVTNQTIKTNAYYPAIRQLNPYPYPNITESDYNRSASSFIKNVGGVSVTMCKDKYPLRFGASWLLGKDSLRGKPYVDVDCVKSQASVLMPNVIEAGAHALRVFIPWLVVEVKEAKVDSGGIIRGKISYAIPSFEDEYSGLFDLTNMYNGPVTININSKAYTGTGTARKNTFEIRLNGAYSSLKKDDQVVASIEFGGIVVKSEPCKFSNAETVTIPQTKIVNLSNYIGDMQPQYTLGGTAQAQTLRLNGNSVNSNYSMLMDMSIQSDVLPATILLDVKVQDLSLHHYNPSLDSQVIFDGTYWVAPQQETLTRKYQYKARFKNYELSLQMPYATSPTPKFSVYLSSTDFGGESYVPLYLTAIWEEVYSYSSLNGSNPRTETKDVRVQMMLITLTKK
ncbi:MAG: hypothetical protein V1799_12940 [bacterium]